jgi:hypothetical protein
MLRRFPLLFLFPALFFWGSLAPAAAAADALELWAGGSAVRVLIDGATASSASALLARVLPELVGVLDVAAGAGASAAAVEVRLSLSPDYRSAAGAAAERCAHAQVADGDGSPPAADDDDDDDMRTRGWERRTRHAAGTRARREMRSVKDMRSACGKRSIAAGGARAAAALRQHALRKSIALRRAIVYSVLHLSGDVHPK